MTDVPHPWASRAAGDVRRVATVPLSEVDFAIRSEAETVATGVRWEAHAHEVHELLWSTRGVLSVRTGRRLWALPAGAGVWIPAGTEHHAHAGEGSGYRAVYLAPTACPAIDDDAVPVAVDPALRELLGLLDGSELPADVRGRVERLAIDLLALARREEGTLAELLVPDDPRIREIAAAVVADPGDRTGLAQWARRVGQSERTIARAFREATGLSFREWRTTVRVHCAMALLVEGMPVHRVAALIGYETSSAFVAAFRRATGMTPGSLR